MPNPLYIYITYKISKLILKIEFLNKPTLFLFIHSQMVSLNFKQFSLASVQSFVYAQLVTGLNTIFCLHSVECKHSSISNNSV